MNDTSNHTSRDDEGQPTFGTGPVSVPVRLDMTEVNRQIEEMSAKIKESFTKSMQMDPSGFRAKEGDFTESTANDTSARRIDRLSLELSTLTVLVRQLKDAVDTINVTVQTLANT